MTTGRLLTLVAVLGVAGCHGDASTGSANLSTRAAAGAGPAKAGSTAVDLTAGMVEAVTLGKSAVPVAIKFELPERPMIGRPSEIAIAVIPAVAATAAVIQASGSVGLKVAATPLTIPSVIPAQVYRVVIPITPTADGLQLLGLDVALKLDETTDHRFFSVPILVTARADPTGAPTSAASGGGMGQH